MTAGSGVPQRGPEGPFLYMTGMLPLMRWIAQEYPQLASMPNTSPAQAYADDAMAWDKRAEKVVQDLMQRYGRDNHLVRGAASGDLCPPPSPPLPAQEQTRAGRRDSGPAPPRGGRSTRGGGTPRPRQARPRAKRPRWTARTIPHYPLPPNSEAGLGKAGARTRARRSLPPPPAALTHWQPTGPRLAPTAARQPPQHEYTPRAPAGDKG